MASIEQVHSLLSEAITEVENLIEIKKSNDEGVYVVADAVIKDPESIVVAMLDDHSPEFVESLLDSMANFLYKHGSWK